jgi:chromosome segregation ATPase
MSETLNFENLVVDSIPFASNEGRVLFRVTENSRDVESDTSFHSTFCENNEKMKTSEKSELSEPCSSFDLCETDLPAGHPHQEQILIHQLEIEKETWRVESLKKGLKLKEHEKTIEDLKLKISQISSNKSPRLSSDPTFVTISKNEFAEINFHRMTLEKEIARLRQSLGEKEEEVKQLQIELQSFDFKSVAFTPGHSRKTSALATLDGNVAGLRRVDEKPGEKQDLQRRLHESLRVNDGLTRNIRELQEKIRTLESEKWKESPSTSGSGKKNSRTSSITSFNQLKRYETEQDLELYIKKYKEALSEIDKLESLNKETQQVIQSFHMKTTEKKEKIRDLTEKIRNLSSTVKSLENQLFSLKSQKDSDTEKYHQEIISLKRNLDIVHSEREQLEVKLRNSEDLKSKLSAVVQSWETSKANESRLSEELYKLKTVHSSQESLLNNTRSQLAQLEFKFQNIESSHSSTLKTLHEKESALLSQIEKNSKLSSKVQKVKQKVQKYKNGNQNTFNDFKDLTRNYMSQKQQNEKLFDTNTELRFMVKSLEETKEKLLLRNEELSHSRSDLISKLNSFEQSAFEKLSTLNQVKEEKEKFFNETTSLKFELQKKHEDYILAKAETRKIMSDVSDLSSKLKKSLEQEDFLQKLLKNSEGEIKRLTEKISLNMSQLQEKDLKIDSLSSELVSSRTQVNVVSADLKKAENNCRLMNIENYTLQSKIEELDKIRLEPGNEASFKEEYFKLVRAYQHLNEELSITRANLAQTQTQSQNLSKSLIITNETLKSSHKDPALLEAHLESLQIKLEGALDEKVSLERKVEFLTLEKNELEKNIQKLKEEVENKERKIGSNEKYLIEIQKYRSEIRRMENEQEKLKHELAVALNKCGAVQKWAKGVEESFSFKDN